MSDDSLVAVVDDDRSLRVAVERLLRSHGLEVKGFESARGFLEWAPPDRPLCLVLDVRMPGLSGLDLQDTLRQSGTEVPIVFITAHGDVPMSVRALKSGAEDFLPKPFKEEKLLDAVHRALDRDRRNRAVRAELEELGRRAASLAPRDQELYEWVARGLLKTQEEDPADHLAQLIGRLGGEGPSPAEWAEGDHDFEELVGRSGAMAVVLFKARQVAATDATVLLLGETGTGKGLLARAIHDRSRRQGRPLVKIDCAALPAGLIESELFGHEKGAFTGATQTKPGRFEAADGGTVFLDEVGELPLDLQSKLLRVVQDGEIERLGGTRTKHVDVRVIAATNRNLKKEVLEKRFRTDLYYRLNVFPIEIPPLRDRRQDVPLLATFLLSRLNRKMGRTVDQIPPGAMEALVSYDWPGNVRELQNVIEGALIVSPGRELKLTPPSGLQAAPPQDHSGELRQDLTEIERLRILEALEASSWRVKGDGNAASRLGLSPSTLRSRMQKLGIERPL